MPSQNKPYEGLFITIEGGDGAGKSTLIEGLVRELSKEAYEVISTHEPGGSLLSNHIRALLLENSQNIPISEKAELFLFLAARVQHLEEKILPALYSGKVVICDRFNDSTIAYQGCARHLGKYYVENLCHMACGDLTPDITIFLDLDPQLGLNRAFQKKNQSLDRMEKEHKQFHSEVRQGFLHLADEYPQRIRIIDASLFPEEVLKQSLAAIHDLL